MWLGAGGDQSLSCWPTALPFHPVPQNTAVLFTEAVDILAIHTRRGMKRWMAGSHRWPLSYTWSQLLLASSLQSMGWLRDGLRLSLPLIGMSPVQVSG